MGGWLFGDALGRALAIFGAGLGGFISWRLSRRDPAGGRQTMMFKKTLACSFCGRTEADVEKLVAGPRVFICDRCAAEVMRIMNESGPGRSLTGTSPDSPWRAPLKRLHGWWRRGARRSRPSAGQL